MRHWESVNGTFVKVYDNGGKTMDRYTVVYKRSAINSHGIVSRFFDCLGMNETPFHPQGFGQHSECSVGSHLGKRIEFRELPTDCRKAVMQDIDGYKGRR